VGSRRLSNANSHNSSGHSRIALKKHRRSADATGHAMGIKKALFSFKAPFVFLSKKSL
jgi:hypothetical protein